jgi:type II secretory pathway component PulK
VILVEVKQPLRAQDFEALAVTADAWIKAHGELQGLVIHAREFPGWENLGSFFRHVRFARDHQRKVKKIALAVDSKLASLVPMITEHFVQAEIKSFAYSELDSAIAWAAGFSTQTAASSRSASN